MAVQIMETLRRRRAVVLATGALAGAALAVAGCGGSSESGSAAGDVASYVPAGSPFYLEVTTDFDGPQWTQIDELAKLFPAYPEFRKMLDEELQGGDVNFDRDVKPLLGDRAAVGVLNVPDTSAIEGSLTSTDPESAAGAAAGAADDTEVVGVVDIAEGKEDAVTALLVRGGATKAGEHDGVSYYTQPDDDTVAAVADGALVVTNSTGQLYKALDAHEASVWSPGRTGSRTRSRSSRPTSSARPTSTSARSSGRPARTRRSSSSSASTTTRTPSSRRRSRPSPTAPA